MEQTIVTLVTGAAVAVAALILFRLRAVERPLQSEPTEASPTTAGARLREAVRTLAAAAAGGTGAGFLVAGFGGRLFMRIIAATSDDAAQGRFTEADAVIGEVSFGGTAFLVFFGGGIGLLGGLGYYIFRRWLPDRSLVAGLIAAGIGAGVLALPIDLLNPESIDFEILAPRWLAIVFAIALILGLGTVGATLIDHFTGRWPAPGLTIVGGAGLLPLLLIALLGPGALVAVAVLAAKTINWPRLTQSGRSMRRAIPALVAAGGAIGWVWCLSLAAQIVL